MAGNKAGGEKAAKTNLERYGRDFYRMIGSKGGQKQSPNRGFASTKVGKDGLTGAERAKIAGAKGGRHSTRTGIKNGEGQVHKEKEYIYDKNYDEREW